MVRHIVLFKIKDKSLPEERDEFIGGLRGLKEKTDGLMIESVVALDIASTHNSYDVVLNSLFENMETLKKYQKHPEHVKVLEAISKACSAVVKIDYNEDGTTVSVPS